MEHQAPEWLTLKVISETLNQSSELQPMLQSVLERLLRVTGLTTGWIFLVEERTYMSIASYGLPPALTRNHQQPLCQGSCWCLDKYRDGRLEQAVNIIECKRLDAAHRSGEDTQGITFHATIPLAAGEEKLGILNVASPGKESFTEDELALLQSVAYQIGTAVKKTRLLQSQRKRADNYAKLEEVARFIWQSRNPQALMQKLTGYLSLFGWLYVALWEKNGDRLILRSLWRDGELTQPNVSASADQLEELGTVLHDYKAMWGTQAPRLLQKWMPGCLGLGIAPYFHQKNQVGGVLCFGYRQESDVDEIDLQVLKMTADHLSLFLEGAWLEGQQQQLLVSEERNRLARDLHDSVNQKLFSLSLTARGLKEVISDSNPMIQESLADIDNLSREALGEMRSLIWQLRPQGLEEGLMTALKRYGHNLGLSVKEEMQGLGCLPRSVEETLWRIGQEALNNVSKHAQTRQVRLWMGIKKEQAELRIVDEGCGFLSSQDKDSTLGLIGMRERAALLGGSLEIVSEQGKGTVVYVKIPLQRGG